MHGMIGGSYSRRTPFSSQSWTFQPPWSLDPLGTMPATLEGRESNRGPRAEVETMPDLERMRLDHVVRRPTPRGVIAPRPVTTTLRMTSLFGDGGPQDR